MTDDELQSKTITWLRFPMIVGVLLIHSYNPNLNNGGMLLGNGKATYLLFQFTRNLFSEVLARFCVPLFFLLAGYLFFYRLSSFSPAIYLDKLKKRTGSLLVPYLFWNALAIITYVLCQQVLKLHTLAYGAVPSVSSWEWTDYLKCFWAIRAPHYPLVYPLWFLRDLMVTILLTPFIYAGIRYLKIFFVLFFFSLWISNTSIVSIVGVNMEALFFFSLGAYFSINQKNLVTESRKVFRLSLYTYPPVALADVLSKGHEIDRYIHPAGMLLGILFTVNLVAYLLQHNKIRESAYLAGASFFVYAAHEQMLSQIRKMLATVIPLRSEIAYFALYLLPMLLTIFITLSIYYLLKKYCPAAMKIMVGARK
ncbi:acyltransferase [uncultured Bacteroides sp.]|uniref:acyltransferase family protein n=1 Tax=uncultured Bacteroides sp. TaxID=162156 RepID=UPI002AA63FD4|nr:acyltransferase [uncultured Bacteroides sp.]